MSPLEIGEPGVRHALLAKTQAALRGEGDLRVVSVDEAAISDGVEVVAWTYESPEATITILIDLKRGAIPLQNRSVVKPSGDVYLERYDDIRQVDGAGWLPFRKLALLPGGSARILEVQQADFRTPPPASAFQLEFEQPQAIPTLRLVLGIEPRWIEHLFKACQRSIVQ
jgi:hypothetical protein